MTCGSCVLILISIVELGFFQYAESIYDDYDIGHTRLWSSWYNTDDPVSGFGDDESVPSIRRRGFEVCEGSEPLDAICRIASDPATVFNEHTTSFTRDQLHVPCSRKGVVCRDVDQEYYDGQRNCSDYAIRFECLVSQLPKRSENLGIIAVAAGLSVIVPIVCVLTMHVTRLVKERRSQARRRRGSMSSIDSQETLNQDQSIQTELADAPPTYDQLFGINFGSTFTLLGNSLPTSTDVVNNTRDVNDASSSEDDTDAQDTNGTQDSTNERLFSISDGHLENVPRLTIQNENEAQTLLPHFRAPGMHISIFDLMTSTDSTGMSPNSPTTPEYIQTPPPTYKDALALFGLTSSQNAKS